ncbi:MAG: gamma-glutamyl-gamma-aminobutyrate hydrolase family protein [Gammaproteobacteria bacterium]|nr:gamma-glutamyl-gamma-aminobutyrate hydrolase family protein [Gammaproteobacteria bacterium]
MREHNAARPLVAVTGPDKKLRFGWWAARLMLGMAGLRACYVTPRKPHYPDGIRAVLIGGGDDIDPAHYGLTGDAGANYDPARDALEIEVLGRARAAGVPIMGICRGAQLINVVYGGNLYADIRPLRQLTPNRNSLFPVKRALLRAGSRLAALLDKNYLWINSLHHQAIDSLGDGFEVAARDADGFVQAIEASGDSYVLGVQWHPEYLPYIASQRKIFSALADAIRASSATLDARHNV